MAGSLTLAAMAVLLVSVSCQRRDRDFDRDFRPDARPDPERMMVTIPDCEEKVMDIIFVLDSSSSIWVRDYEREQEFVKNVVAHLDVNQRYTRVGVITFSDDISRGPITLTQYQNKNEVIDAVSIQTLPYRTGITNTDSAIRYVREMQETRTDITKVIVMVTDGGSRSPGATAMEAERAREDGFYLFVVGVGQYLDQAEWRAIASDPNDQFIYNITNFRVLSDVTSTLPARACLLPPITKDCNALRPADLFVVAGPEGTPQAMDLLVQLFERTNDVNQIVSVSYLMDICDGAFNVPVGDVDTHCNRNLPLTDGNDATYTNLLGRLRDTARESREDPNFHNGRQVALLFVDSETMNRDTRFEVVTEAREAAQEMEVIVIDLGVDQRYGSYLSSIRRDRDVVRFLDGDLDVQTEAQQGLVDRTCNGFNMRDSFRPRPPTRPVDPSK